MATQTEQESPHKGHSLAETLRELTGGISPALLANDRERSEALSAAYALVSQLENPWETMMKLSLTQPALVASLKVVKDLQLFEKWHERGNVEMTGQQLGEMVSCHPTLLARLLRHLAATYILQQTPAGLFKPTPFTNAMLQPLHGEYINWLHDSTLPCFYKTPEYLAKTGYQVPRDPANTVFQYAKDWKGSFFEYYEAHPEEGRSFNHVMEGVATHQPGWIDIIPREMLLDSDPNLPLLVDIGGNIGHDVEKLRQAHPETAPRLYLQDKASVIQRSQCPDPVKKMDYDFFTPQPIKGARVYYLHAVLHDWSDELAQKILEMQRGALKPGYSKLLIHEYVVPETMAHPYTTAYDLTMMTLVAGEERTESHWRRLLQSAGYKVLKVWIGFQGAQSIIEAELATDDDSNIDT